MLPAFEREQLLQTLAAIEGIVTPARDLISECVTALRDPRYERERDVIVAMARFGFGLSRIGEILDLPAAHIRATLGHAEPAEQEADRG